MMITLQKSKDVGENFVTDVDKLLKIKNVECTF